MIPEINELRIAKTALKTLDPTTNWEDPKIRIEIVKSEPIGIVKDELSGVYVVRYPTNPSALDDFIINFQKSCPILYYPPLERLQEILEKAKKEKSSFDIETNTLNPFMPGAKIICYSISFDDESFAIPICEPFIDSDRGKIYEDFMIEYLKNAVDISMQNGIFDVTFVCHLYWERIKPEEINYKFDTQFAAHVLTGAGLLEYNLQYLAGRFVGAPMWKGGPSEWLAEHFSRVKDRTYDKVPPYILLPYAKKDAYWTHQLRLKLEQLLEKEDMADVYEKIHLKIVSTCLEMHLVGLYTDKFMLDFLENLYTKKMEEAHNIFRNVLRRRLKKLYEEDEEGLNNMVSVININSPKQVGALVFDVFGMPVLEKTVKTKAPKTGVKLLQKLSSFDPELFSSYFTYKKWSKYIGYLKNYVKFSGQTFGEKVSKFICAHSYFNPMGARTGRTSSVRPNAQNINLGSGLKGVFCPPDRANAINDIYFELRKRGMKTFICEAHFNLDLLDKIKETKESEGDE